MSKELFTYYNLSECVDTDLVLERLEDLSTELKVDYKQLDAETLKVSDLELSDKEIDGLIKLFDDTGVIVDLTYDEELGYDGDLDEYFNGDYDY